MRQITKGEWKKKHKDYKTIIDGQKYILVMGKHGAQLEPVEIKNGY